MVSNCDSPYFKPGSRVEVSIDSEGFRGAWFSGTIVRQVCSGKFLVMYHNRIADDEQALKPLREVVSLGQLRPLPPPDTRCDFKSGDTVDAFHNNAWRKCHVSQCLGNGMFRLYFADSKETMAFPNDLLRFHYEWVCPNWFLSTQTRRVNKRNREDCRDRISELPDTTLLRIINFMDTKSAVRTCVLSKRWRNVCKCLTDLTFCNKQSGIECFKNFAYWVMSSRDDSCSLFSLHIDSGIETQLLDGVFKYAVYHNIQELTIDSHYGFAPSCCESLLLVFCCKSLTSLKICFGWNPLDIMLPKSLCLPALKSLHLETVKFTASDDGCAEPFSNCPVLNTLKLDYCSVHEDAEVLCISNPTLSHLRIRPEHDFKIVLSTPNLRSLAFLDFHSRQLSTTCHLSFLEEVNVDQDMEDSLALMPWLHVLTNVKTLTFYTDTLKIMLHDLLYSSSMIPQPPRFARLETLKVDKQSFADISEVEVNKIANYLLQNTPMAKVDIKMEVTR